MLVIFCWRRHRTVYVLRERWTSYYLSNLILLNTMRHFSHSSYFVLLNLPWLIHALLYSEMVLTSKEDWQSLECWHVLHQYLQELHQSARTIHSNQNSDTSFHSLTSHTWTAKHKHWDRNQKKCCSGNMKLLTKKFYTKLPSNYSYWNQAGNWGQAG